jgi:DNA modification methylase
MGNSLSTLDKVSRDKLLNKLSGLSSKGNEISYEFAVALYKDLSGVDWKSSGGKMKFLEDLSNRPTMCIKDAGCLRQIQMAGGFLNNHCTKDEFGEISKKIYYWTLHNITRARLSPDDESNVEKKKEIINEILVGELPEGKVKARIRTIRDTIFPKALDEILDYYNVWSFGSLDKRFGIEHPGQIPGQVLVNVIYHYLNKSSVVVDPMAGGGTTHDVCDFFNFMKGDTEDQTILFEEDPYNLKCHSFDLEPKRDFIIKKDVLEDDWKVEDSDLVFLDPPYYSMMKDDYVPNEFTKSRESFFAAIDKVMLKSYNSLKENGLCALIIQPQTEKDLEEGEVCIDLPFECYKIMEKYFKPFNRIQVPLSTQQFSATDVNRVKKYENKHRLLGISRDLIIMKK